MGKGWHRVLNHWFSWRLNSCDASRSKRITLLKFARLNRRQGFWLHSDLGSCCSDPLSHGLISHIHHVGLAFAIEMGQGLLVAHWAVLLFAKGLEAYPNYGMLCREGVMQQRKLSEAYPDRP